MQFFSFQDLNDRFATYIEKIRVYEVENKRLRGENENLRKALVQLEQKMKEMYEQELAAARKVIDETTKAKVRSLFMYQRCDSLRRVKQLSTYHNMSLQSRYLDIVITLFFFLSKDKVYKDIRLKFCQKFRTF